LALRQGQYVGHGAAKGIFVAPARVRFLPCTGGLGALAPRPLSERVPQPRKFFKPLQSSR
jgi:hypothetical protein